MNKIAIVEFPLETKEQAQKMAKNILEKELAIVVRVIDDVWQAWKEEKVDSAEVVILRCRVPLEKVDALYKYVKENHPWPVFCFDVIEVKAMSA